MQPFAYCLRLIDITNYLNEKNMNMRGFIGMITLFSFLLTTTTACSQINRVKANGTYKTKNIKIGSFDKINLQGSPTVIYTQSTDNKSTLEIYGSDNILNLVECTVSDGTLFVSFKKGTNIEFGKEGRLKIMASSPMLKDVLLQGSGDVVLNNKVKSDRLSLTLKGSGDINAGEIVCTNAFSATLQGSGDISVKSSINAGNVDLNLSGSGDLDFVGIQGETVKAELQGSGDLKVAGTAQRAVLSLRNSGDLNAKDLKAVDVDASVDGSGSISCYVSGTLKCNISGSGDIGYKGSPVNIQSNGKRNPRKL
uniref:head GIN domain-containing protein n=1 Tax=Bacteroides nordii TaxID=291645 RepID=UPI0039C1BC7D